MHSCILLLLLWTILTAANPETVEKMESWTEPAAAHVKHDYSLDSTKIKYRKESEFTDQGTQITKMFFTIDVITNDNQTITAVCHHPNEMKNPFLEKSICQLTIDDLLYLFGPGMVLIMAANGSLVYWLKRRLDIKQTDPVTTFQLSRVDNIDRDIAQDSETTPSDMSIEDYFDDENNDITAPKHVVVK